MSRTTLLSASIVALLLSPAWGDLVILQKIESPQQNSEMKMQLKGDQMRTDVGDQVTSIMNVRTGDSLTLMHPQKMSMKSSAAQMKAMMQQAEALSGKSAAAALTPTKPKATGKKETINGLETEEYVSEVGGNTVTMAIAPKHPKAAAYLKHMGALKNSPFVEMLGKDFASAMSDLPGVPVRTVTKMGEQTMTSTIASIEETTVDPKQFETPAGYKEMAMPTMPAAPK